MLKTKNSAGVYFHDQAHTNMYKKGSMTCPWCRVKSLVYWEEDALLKTLFHKKHGGIRVAGKYKKYPKVTQLLSEPKMVLFSITFVISPVPSKNESLFFVLALENRAFRNMFSYSILSLFCSCLGFSHKAIIQVIYFRKI